MADYLENTKVLKALGDPRRAMIVDMLSCGQLCACDISQLIGMPQSTLSHHMKVLCECGLVRGRGDGKWTYYSLDADAVNRIRRFLRVITSDKDNCICKEDIGFRKGCS